MRGGNGEWKPAVIRIDNGAARAIVAVKVRADFTLDGQIVPLLFKADGGETLRVDRVLSVAREELGVLGSPAIRYSVRCGEYLYDLYYDPHKTPRWFVPFDVARLSPMMVSEIDAP